MRDTIMFAGSRSRILVFGEETRGAWSLLHNAQPPGNATPPHLHRRETEVPFVLGGDLSIEMGGRKHVVTSGGIAVLPKDQAHRLSNVGTVDAKYLLLCAPAGFERFTVDVGERASTEDAPTKPMTDADRRRLADVAPSYGIELLDEEALQSAAPDHETDPVSDIVEVIGIRVEVLARTGPNDADPALLRATFPPGAQIPLHSHLEPECFVVLEGRLDVHVDGVWHHREAGEHVFVPSGARHAVRNTGDVSTSAVCATALSLATFFRAAGSPVGMHPPGPPTPEQMRCLLEAAADHGHTLYGPQEQADAGL